MKYKVELFIETDAPVEAVINHFNEQLECGHEIVDMKESPEESSLYPMYVNKHTVQRIE